MPTTRLRIATRKSPLALWQAEHVATWLRTLYPALEVALVGKVTQGDKLLDSPLAKVGGKGLFVKELEQSLLAGEADIAVHSMKDVPVEIPEGLAVPVILAREDPRDAFVSRYPHPDALPSGAQIGTSSLRRQCQWAAQHPDWQVVNVRGNVGSRLAKLDSGAVDALFLAVAGLKRLGLEDRITVALAPEWSLPAIGQGAIGIECRADDPTIHALIAPLDDVTTHQAVAAERALNTRLQGGCQVPIAGHAIVEGEQLWLRGLVGAPDGSVVIRDEVRGPVVDAALLGTTLAERLLTLGAGKILQACGMG